MRRVLGRASAGVPWLGEERAGGTHVSEQAVCRLDDPPRFVRQAGIDALHVARVLLLGQLVGVWTPLGVVAVEQAVRSVTCQDGGEFPRRVTDGRGCFLW